MSFVGHLLHGEPVPERDLFWRMRNSRALRRGDLKYVRDPDGNDRLHDLSVDQHEQANLAAVRPDDLEALRSAWEAIDASSSRMPTEPASSRAAVARRTRFVRVTGRRAAPMHA